MLTASSPTRLFTTLSRRLVAHSRSRFISSTTSAPRYLYNPLFGVETLEDYKPGGFHPIQLGDCLQDRYRIVDKLGSGAFSTIWLSHDQQLSRYVAIKIGSAEAGRRELDTLLRLAEGAQTGSRGRDLIPTVLDHFSIEGPNGTHPCLVTTPARCSLAAALEESSSNLFQLDVARSLAAQLVTTVAHIHDQGFVHGDLHLGNMLLQFPSPSPLDTLSEADLHAHYGAPDPLPITRIDGSPLPPNVPTHAYSPLFLGEPSHALTLADAHLLLSDFGAAFSPSTTNPDTQPEPCTPLLIRPPETRFDPTTPRSYASDIWSLGCSLWELLAQGTLFFGLLPTQDSVTCEQVDVLGVLNMPGEWWGQWGARGRYFTEDGKEAVGGRVVRGWGERFEVDVVEARREREEMGIMGEEEREAFLEMVRAMVRFRPGERVSAREVLGMRWMREWALPAWERGGNTQSVICK